MLSVCSGKEMIEAIENDDIKKLQSLPGIGAKTAGQIVLDLKGKFVSLETSDVLHQIQCGAKFRMRFYHLDIRQIN